jgi:hypothetical protein
MSKLLFLTSLIEATAIVPITKHVNEKEKDRTIWYDHSAIYPPYIYKNEQGCHAVMAKYFFGGVTL